MKLAREENTRALIGDDKEAANPYDSLNTLWKAEEGSLNASASGKKMRKGMASTFKEFHNTAYGVSFSPHFRQFVENAGKAIKIRKTTLRPSVSEISQETMTEFTKVLLPVSVVFPDGSALMPSGSLSIAHAAARHAVPIYGLAAFYKLAPYFSADSAAAVNAQAARELPVKLADSLRNRVILSPVFDVVPAHLLSLYISNSGADLPSQMHPLISDYYLPEDLT